MWFQIGRNCRPKWARLKSKTGEIAHQFRLFWFAISPNLVCEICPIAESKGMNDDADNDIVRKRTKPII